MFSIFISCSKCRYLDNKFFYKMKILFLYSLQKYILFDCSFCFTSIHYTRYNKITYCTSQINIKYFQLELCSKCSIKSFSYYVCNTYIIYYVCIIFPFTSFSMFFFYIINFYKYHLLCVCVYNMDLRIINFL